MKNEGSYLMRYMKLLIIHLVFRLSFHGNGTSGKGPTVIERMVKDCIQVIFS